ncbi:MAG TPA: hypothetical protein VMO20_07950 [Candidatus Acidoferrum sp.]|nr:hypothetical protein [Candidatus Acidoferrum sp.]
MKTRASIIWFLAIIAVLIVLVLWLGRKKSAEMPQAASSETNAATPAIAVMSPLANAPVHSNAPVTQAAPGAPIPPPTESKEQQMREGLAELNNENISLYGRVMDQFDAPVAGATVTGTVQVNNGARVGSDQISLVTDDNGLFTVSGYKGKALGINITKTGYVMAATNTYFVYSLLWPASRRFTPDPNNPTVIKMWKLQGAESLVDISKEYRLPPTSTPIFFDLVAGKVVPTGGDLEAVVTRASGSLSKKNPGDWSIDLKPVKGGIIESDYQAAQVTFEAPAEGYQDDYLVQMNSDDPAWHDGIDQEFFLKSRDGQVYSKFYLVFGINREPDDPLYFQFKGVANMNGSRNWEANAPQ